MFTTLLAQAAAATAPTPDYGEILSQLRWDLILGLVLVQFLIRKSRSRFCPNWLADWTPFAVAMSLCWWLHSPPINAFVMGLMEGTLPVFVYRATIRRLEGVLGVGATDKGDGDKDPPAGGPPAVAPVAMALASLSVWSALFGRH